MEWIKKISTLDLSGNKHSQFGEEVIVQYILDNIDKLEQPYSLSFKKRFLVDIGAGGAGRNLSNSKVFMDSGVWEGLLFDMDGSGGNIINEFIKPENIVPLLKHHSCPKEFHFLSVDLDSCDYEIIDNVLSEYAPRLVCAEFNGTLDPNIPVKLQYEEGYTWDETNKYGFSFSAGVKLFAKHFYTVIFNHENTNMFAVRNDLLSEDVIKNIKVVAQKNVYHAINPKAVFIPA